jgi:hypothetical protein
VIVTDVDEHLYHPRLSDYLLECKRSGVTCIPAIGFEMVSDTFPAPDERLVSSRTLGVPSEQYSKLRIFDPDAIRETGFDEGGHRALPAGRVILPERDELKLFHYKHMGIEYLQSRQAALGERLRPVDLHYRWGRRYLDDPSEHLLRLASLSAQAVDAVQWHPDGSDSDPHWWRREPRFSSSPASRLWRPRWLRGL